MPCSASLCDRQLRVNLAENKRDHTRGSNIPSDGARESRLTRESGGEGEGRENF